MIANEELKTGDRLKLEITLPDDSSLIHCTGKAVWVNPFSIASEEEKRYYLGVEFQEISKEDREKISKYILKLT